MKVKVYVKKGSGRTVSVDAQMWEESLGIFPYSTTALGPLYVGNKK